MAITNLYMRYGYPANGTDLPALVIMHGWDGETLPDDYISRLARGHDLFVIMVSMRGRHDAGGSRDASSREVYDIYDAVINARALCPGIISADKVALLGFSGGGGSVLGGACKFPDFWNCIVNLYGPSDYGRDATNGWWQQSAYYRDAIATAVGGTPAAVPNNYYARDAVASITNYQGKAYLIHDKQDATVSFVHSSRIKDALDSAGMTNYTTLFSDTGDAVRYTHGLEDDAPEMIYAERQFMATLKSSPVWTIEAAATKIVIGYMKTKRFEIWLDGGVYKGGDAAASVTYDTTIDTYTVTPLTGEMDVIITQGAKTGNATVTEATEIIVT